MWLPLKVTDSGYQDRHLICEGGWEYIRRHRGWPMQVGSRVWISLGRPQQCIDECNDTWDSMYSFIYWWAGAYVSEHTQPLGTTSSMVHGSNTWFSYILMFDVRKCEPNCDPKSLLSYSPQWYFLFLPPRSIGCVLSFKQGSRDRFTAHDIAT